MTRYRIPFIVSVAALAGLVITLVLDGSDWGPLFCGAVLLAGLVWLAVAVGADPAQGRRPIIAHPAGLITLLGLALYAISFVLSAIQLPLGVVGLVLSVVGPPAWMLRISGAPLPDRPGARGRRLLALALLAAPTIGLAVFVVVAIAMEGDLTWAAAPLALPGIVVGAFLVTTTVKTVRQAPTP